MTRQQLLVSMLALVAAWSYGYPSLEAMHEADARALGVVLGLERSPSVRTLHRAIAQMRADYDPVQRWWAGRKEQSHLLHQA